MGGNHAWRSGAPTTAAPGFTTYHDPTGARITNIHRMADLVRGAVIAPGASFSINDHVGERTAEKGFVAAGAIRDGQHVEEIGGGVSQFATTMFNAAYFAGLQIDESQAHSEYFDRYPRGREATMGFPAPDLALHEQHALRDHDLDLVHAEQPHHHALLHPPRHAASRPPSPSRRSGNCTVVTTTRTITYPDGSTEVGQVPRHLPSGRGPALLSERRAAVRVPHERLRCAHVDDREGPAASAPRSPRCRCSTGRSTSSASATRSSAPAARSHALRQRVVGNPYSLAPPRWEIDPELRPRLPPAHASTPAATGGERDVLDLAQWVGMQGFDRARPLWEMYLVDGVADGRSALIQKLHHAITDGVGSIQIALTLFDLERDPGDPGPLPDAPESDVLGPVERLADARRPTSAAGGVGSLQRSAGTVAGGLRGALRRPGGARPAGSPTPSARSGRLLAPATEPLEPASWPAARSACASPRSCARSTTSGPRPRPPTASSTTPSSPPWPAACSATTPRTGAPVEALRMTMPISVRTEATEAVAGNQFVPARFAVPMTIDGPDRAHGRHPRAGDRRSAASRPWPSPSRSPRLLEPAADVGHAPASSAACCAASTS